MLDNRVGTFHGLEMRPPPILPDSDQQELLDSINVRLLEGEELPRCQQLLDEHHYLGGLRPVGERLHYVVTDGDGEWLGVLVFCAAARRLRARDQWIGWSDEQRRRRLPAAVAVPDEELLHAALAQMRCGGRIRVIADEVQGDLTVGSTVSMTPAGLGAARRAAVKLCSGGTRT